MYAGKSNPIKIPTVGDRGKLIIQKNGYIYFVTEAHWDKEKKRKVDNRVCIGKVDPENSEMMFPGKRFSEFFENTESFGEVASVSDIVPMERKLKIGRINFSLSYLVYAVLDKAAEQTGLKLALQKSFPKFCKYILAVAIHAIAAESSTAQLFPAWAYDNWCGLTTAISDSTISRIYAALGKEPSSIQEFFRIYCQEYHRVFPCSTERAVAFDSTNQVSESSGQKKAQYGKSKTAEKLPVINTAMFVDENTGISLWYEHFDGNVLDKSQTPYSVEKAQQLGFKKLFLMVDRGYFSKKNMRSISDLGFGFGMMVPETAKLVSELIAKWKNELKQNEKNYIASENIYGIQTTVTLESDEEYFAYVFYDNDTNYHECNAVHNQINFFMKNAEERIRYSDKMREFYAERGIIVTKIEGQDKTTKRNFTLSVDPLKVQKAYEEAGFFVILSNRLMSAENMIRISRKRDYSEKAFRHLKSHFGLSRTYTHTDESFCGKMFTSFIALVILQSFRWLMRDFFAIKTSETTATLIAELGKYRIIERKDGTWMPVYAMNKKQKALLKAVNLTEEVIEECIRTVKIRRY